MKLHQLFLAVVFVCHAAVTVRADATDPKVDIRVGHGSDPQSCGLDFTIKLNGSGGGIKNCVNTSGQDWIGLDIFAVITATDTVNCTTFFSSCTFSESPSTFGSNLDDVEIVMFGGAEITQGSHFFINLNTNGTTGPSDTGGWFGFDTGLKHGNLSVEAITAPEPSTILLVAAGLGILSTRRRVKSLR